SVTGKRDEQQQWCKDEPHAERLGSPHRFSLLLLKPGAASRYRNCPFLAKTGRSGTIPFVRLDRRQILFLVRFAVLLLVFFVVIWLGPVDRNVIAPFTRALARVSAVVLNVFGERVSVVGSVIEGRGFAVDI